MSKSFNMETDIFRVSFPYLAQPNVYDNKETYQIDAIFDPQTAGVFWANVVAQAQVALAQEYPGREHLFQWSQMKDGNLNIAKTDPQQKVKNGYAGSYYLRFKSSEAVGCVAYDMAQNVDVKIPPTAIYSGCYAKAFIQIWLQDNAFGQRVNIKLLAVKFIQDGESLGGRVPIDPSAVFAAGGGQMPSGAHQAVHMPQAGVVPGMPVPGAPVMPQAGVVPGMPQNSPFLQ